MSSLAELRFFITPEHDCSYIENTKAITLFVDPLAQIDTPLYSNLTAVGFRRSGQHIYRPRCVNCNACIPVRVLIKEFILNKNHQRITRKNKSIIWSVHQPKVTDEYFAVYEKYINSRHSDGDMYPASIDQFESFLVNGREEAIFFEMRDQTKLLGVAVADRILNDLSAIYTFFDPDYEKQSLGTFAILKLIEECREQNGTHLYLGYWIKESRKMSYKMNFKPLQKLVDNLWIRAESQE